MQKNHCELCNSDLYLTIFEHEEEQHTLCLGCALTFDIINSTEFFPMACDTVEAMIRETAAGIIPFRKIP